jgi:hypothetical protein
MIAQLILAATIFALLRRSRSGERLPKIRRLAGLDAIDEAIGRATEMGRPTIFGNGSGGLNSAQTIASFSVLEYAARSCARYDTQLIAVSYVASVYPVMEAIVRTSYLELGKGDSYDPVNTVRFIASGWGASASALQGTMRRERVAACLFMGSYYAETTMITEVGANLGAIQVAGTANTAQLPFMISSCDYTLIGEEFYAAGAYLSKDDVQKVNLVALDYAKAITVIVIIIGALLATFGDASHLKNFLNY